MLMTSLVARMIADGEVKKQYVRQNPYVAMVSYLVRYKNRLWYIQCVDDEVRITCKAYFFRYFSYREGAICEYEMPIAEYHKFAKHYAEKKDIMIANDLKTLNQYIKAVLALNN